MIDYMEEINAYGAALNEKEKPIARNLFNTLLKKEEWNFERLYFAIQLLNGRPISKNRGLFFYPEFLEEVDEKVKAARAFEEKKERIRKGIEKQQRARANREVIIIKRKFEEKRKSKYNLDEI